MSLLYIIDGYNVIKSSSLFCDKELKEGREAFFSFLERFRPQGSLKNELIVVFDGQEGVYSFPGQTSFKTIYSQGTSADDEIKKIVATARYPKNAVVVTDDKELIRSVRVHGARTMSTQEFLGKNKKSRPRSCGQEVSDKVELNIVQKEGITEELRKIWLKQKSS